MKVNLKESTKLILKFASLITVLVTTIVVILVGQANIKKTLTAEEIFENRVAKSYNELTQADKATNVDNVKFAAYFLRDLYNNNVAHMLDGTCKKIGNKDDLYFDIQVNGDSYIENAKIRITNANYKAEFNYLKDDYLKQNYKGIYSQIEFDRIDGGTEEIIMGAINADIGNNLNDYSKTSIVTFTCDYHDIYTGEVTQVEKQVPITVDWYGELSTYVNDGYNVFYPNVESTSYPKVEGNTVNVSFTIEEKSDLLLKDRKIEINIPNLREWEPVTARLSDSNAVYDPETKTITLTTESIYDENGNCTSSIARKTSYKIYITYPEEAFAYSSEVGSDDIFNGHDSIKCETTVQTSAYNNQGEEFENIVTSENTVNPTIAFHEPVGTEILPLGTSLVVEYAHSYNRTSIQNILENYESVKTGEATLNNVNGRYNTEISIQREKINDYGLLKLEEDYVKFGSDDVSNYLQDKKVRYVGLGELLEDDGSMLIYNAETDELVKELTKAEIDQGQEIEISEDVAKVRIEIKNFKKCEGTTSVNRRTYAGKLAYVYIEKTLDVNALINNFEYTTIKNFGRYYSRIKVDAYLKNETKDYTQLKSDNSELVYNKTEATIEVTPTALGSVDASIDDESDDETIGESITMSVTSKHEQDRALWSKGEFIIELPSEFEYFKLDSVNSSTCTINGYEYFEENGKKLVRVFAETNAKIVFKVNAHVLVDPMASSGSKYIKLYYKNEACADYYGRTSRDTYDVDLNDDRNEIIGYATTTVTTTAPSTFIVKQTISNYDDTGAFITAPNIAEVSKETNSATIQIGVKNNNSNSVVDCYLVGKIPYEGNTKVKSDLDLQSQFTTTMSSEGIIIPEGLRNVTVYYSENDDVNFDLEDASNGWKLKEDVTDWSKIKTFLIDLSNQTIRAGGDAWVFKYNIAVPNGISYNDVAYSAVASKYKLQTSAGVLSERGAEAQKTGLRIVRKYDVEATLFKENTTRVVPYENYVVEELDAQENAVKTKIGRSNSEGKFRIKNIYVDRIYKIRQTVANNDYEKDEKVRYFTAHEQTDGSLAFAYAKEQSAQFNNVPSFTRETDTNKDVLNVSIWKTPKYEIIVNKLDRATEEPISGINFLCYNDTDVNIGAKTNNSGKAIIARLSTGEEYTLEEVTAKGYYLQNTKLKLLKDAQYNYSLTVGNNEFVNSHVIQNDDTQDLVKVELILYNDSVPTYTLNVVKVEESKEAVTSENIVKLSDAEFEITKYDDDEKEKITTDENGAATVRNMYQYKEGFDITGKYGLQETKSPSGYVLNKEYIEFVVSKNEDDGTLKIEYSNAENLTTIKDTVIDGTNVTIYIQDKALFKLTKTDDDAALLPNVAFVIYELDENENILDFAKDVNGDYVGTRNANNIYEVRTDNNGEIRIPLRDGDYIIYEIEAPEQYEYSTTGRKFKVKSKNEEETGTGNEGTGETEEEKYTYSVQYYYDGQRDDEKTETYEVAPDTEVTEYVDKVVDGYEFQYVTKLPYKIECDDLVIDVYYATPKTETLEINYIEDLIDLQIAVNNGNNYENTKVVLKRDLDFNNADSYRDATGTTYGDYNEDGEVKGIKEEVTTGKGWKSIGVRSTKVVESANGDYYLDGDGIKHLNLADKLRYFAGVFDGNNNTISNLYIDFSESAYGNTGYSYTRQVSGSDVEYQDYYNGALFGWTHNATFMNLKFDAEIYVLRSSYYSSTREPVQTSMGSGLVGNSYGSINMFNVENNIKGNFSYGGAIGNIDQRLNYFDYENTNINIQDVKNDIQIEEMETELDNSQIEIYYDHWGIGTIGIIQYGGSHDPAITQTIELNKINNSISNNITAENITELSKKIGYSTSAVGTIGSMNNTYVYSSSDYTTYYTNDRYRMYSINSNLKLQYGNEDGAVVGYATNKSVAEYKVNNVKSNVEFKNAYAISGVFGQVYPENTREFLVENFDTELTFTGEDNNSIDELGGVIGYTWAQTDNPGCTITIKHGKSKVDISHGYRCGGIVGQVGKYGIDISDVSTYGKIGYGQGYTNGGIVGYANAESQRILIENANNYSEVSGDDDYLGGIIGFSNNSYASIKNTNNYGNVSGRYYVGGISGYAGMDSGGYFYENINNYGNISVDNETSWSYGHGGIIGYDYGRYCNIKNAKNYGKVTGSYGIGGIVGYKTQTGSNTARLEIYDSVNNAEINGIRDHEYVGGIVGYASGSTYIDNSNNLATIKIQDENFPNNGLYYAGGILAKGDSAEIRNCYNKGNLNIIDINYAYEIAGILGYANTALITNCYNDGNISITGAQYVYSVGGIIGLSDTGYVNNAVNNGKIYVNCETLSGSSNGIGGITGYKRNLTINNAINHGEIEIVSVGMDFYDIGGIAGENYTSINNAYNTGNIRLLGGTYSSIPDNRGVGGIVGSNTSSVSNCYNTGKVTAMLSTGGIAGYNGGGISNCYNEGKITSYGRAVGGIAGSNTGGISNSYNVADVVAKKNNMTSGPIMGENTGGASNSYYSDKITVIGDIINQGEGSRYGTEEQDDYMKTEEFYNTLNTSGVWVYMNNQYPKLMINAGEEIAEATELNVVNNHKIYSISTTLNNPAGGTITGYGQDFLEQVRHGESNTREIEMIPNEGYEISKITINNEQQVLSLNEDGSYKISADAIKNITNDKVILVEFLKQDQILEINKIDKDTSETLSDATFSIMQIESTPITNEISELKDSNLNSETAADLENTIDDVIGSPIMQKGSCVKSNDTYRFTSAYDYYSYGYFYTFTAKLPINLANYTGKYVVRFEGDAYFSDYSIYDSNNQDAGWMDVEDLPNDKQGYTQILEGGKNYYIKISETRRGNNFTRTVDNFHVYCTTDTIYNMATTDEGYFETTNANVPLATSAGYVDVDLSNHPEEYILSVKNKNDQNSGAFPFNVIITNKDTNEELYDRKCTAYYTENEELFYLPGEAKYKVEFRYNNASGGPAKVQITDVSLEINHDKLTTVSKTTDYKGQIKVQLPVGKYAIVETKAPEHYLRNTDAVLYYVDINKENKVTVEEEHKPRVRVHHYLMENGEATTKKVAEDEEYEGLVDQDYYFNPRNDLEGLSLAKDDNDELIIPSNYKGKYTLGITDVNFYYEAEDIKLTIHHYLEGTQTKVAEDEEIVKEAVVIFNRDNSYTVSTTGTYTVAENAKYQELTASDYNLSSLYSSVQAGLGIDDTLEYSTNAELIYNYSTKKYRIVTRVIEHEEIVEDDAEDETDESDEQTNPMTNTTSDENANDSTDENTNTTETTPKTKTISVKGGTISGYELEYYEELQSNANSTKDIIVTPDRGYKIKVIKLNDNVIYDAEHTTSDLYTVDENGILTFNTFNNVTEDKTITVEFEGVGSIVKVHHIITEDGQEDNEYKTVEIRGRVGTRYTTTEIEIEGYYMYSSTLNLEGEITEDEIHVYYYYKANPKATYTIRYFYDEVEDTESAERITENTQTVVAIESILNKIEEHEKAGYKYEKAENIPLMITTATDEYVIKIYYVSLKGSIIEKHIDKIHNNVLYTEEHFGKIGDSYEVQPRDIEGYALAEIDMEGNSILPTNAEGTYKKDVVEVVTYYYTRNTTVKVIYEDENETELDKVIIEGNEGDEYTTEEKTIKGYELVEIPKNAEGVMTVTKDADGHDNTETVVKYKYKKLVPGDVVEKYVDVNTNEVVEEVTNKGEIDEEYEIVPKTIEGYTLITKDADGNDILPTNTKGKYTTEKVEIVYYVALNTTVRVQYINLITGDKMTDDVIIEGYEGREYTTEAKTFEGYELTSTPEDAKGKMKVTLDENGNKVTELAVRYYYAEILDGKLPQTNETNTKQAILIAIPFVVLINIALGIAGFKKSKKEDNAE